MDAWRIAGSVLHAVWTGVISSAWGALAAGLFVLLAAVRAVQAVRYPRWVRDPVRRFSRIDKLEILRRAGGRCEHHAWIAGRCPATDALEADHVIPWSRSGPTIVGNGQALCRRHNRSKRATIPFGWQLRALAKRRVGYFPAGVSGHVVRRRLPENRTVRRSESG